MKIKCFQKLIFTALIFCLIFLPGCSTLSVKPPEGMFLSTGDYVPDIKTMGILQVSTSVLAPLFIYDINAIRVDLYEALLDKAKFIHADGVTNVQFFWKMSPFTYLSMFIGCVLLDFYMEGVAIET